MALCIVQKAWTGYRTDWNCSCPRFRSDWKIPFSLRWENWSWPRDCPIRWDCNVYVRAIHQVTNAPAAVAAAAIPRAFHSQVGTYIARLYSISGLSQSFDQGSVNSSAVCRCSFSTNRSGAAKMTMSWRRSFAIVEWFHRSFSFYSLNLVQ